MSNEKKKIISTEELIAGGEDIRIRQISADICDVFEELLDAHNITIPDEYREGHDGEARLYGETYSYVEDSITAILTEFAEILRKHPGKPLNEEEY